MHKLSPLLALILVPLVANGTGDYIEEPIRTLPEYLKLDQVPAKSFGQIVSETAETGDAKPVPFSLKEAEQLEHASAADALPKINAMLANARIEGSGPLQNLCNDLHDLFAANEATAAEIAGYIQWRLKHLDWFQLRPDGTAAPDDDDGQIEKNLHELESALEDTSPALRPHWLCLRGALLFRLRNVKESQECFDSIVKQFPAHPRAEVAAYVAARCQVSLSRSPGYLQYEPDLVEAERPAFKQRFEHYLAKYPNGRFTADALGWLGAYYFDGGDNAHALEQYLRQLNTPNHPELVDSASEMVELILSRLESTPDSVPVDDIAKEPTVAQALVSLLASSSEADGDSTKDSPTVKAEGKRQQLLARLANAVARSESSYQSNKWHPRYLSILAMAASSNGNQDDALRILETGKDQLNVSDDLLLAKGVTLQRMKRNAEAIAAFRQFLKTYPSSSQVSGVRLRLGLALLDDHKASEAVLELDQLVGTDDYTHEHRDPSEVDPDQVRRLIDGILNFSPIAELAARLKSPELSEVNRLRFSEVIAQRLLTKEDFNGSKEYMSPAKWQHSVANLAHLTEKVAATKDPAAKAAACLAVGDAWAAARGQLLTYPLDSDKTRSDVYFVWPGNADIQRALAAPVLGAKGNYKLDLENRDELRHAFNWWLQASDAQPGKPITASALWKALKSMPAIADVSPFHYQRALERNWSAVSHKLYDRLRTECPNSIEAKRLAVFWDFPRAERTADQADASNRADVQSLGSGSTNSRDLLAGAEDEDGNGVVQGSAKSFTDEVMAVETLAATSTQRDLKKKVDALQKKARTVFTSAWEATWLNLLEDLSLFLSEPHLDQAMQARYVSLRFSFLKNSAVGSAPKWKGDTDMDSSLQEDIARALNDPKTKPVADYFEFLNLAVIANHLVNITMSGTDKGGEPITYRSRDYVAMEKAARDFLDKYPKSRKREAAMLLLARATYHASRIVTFPIDTTWPMAASWENGSTPVTTQQEPFDPKRVLGPLDQYDRSFPRGRYSAHIALYRGAVALRLHQWRATLDSTVASFDNPDAPDIKPDAAEQLGQIFDCLTDEHHRADLLPAILANPRAKELCIQYVNAQTGRTHLSYLKPWLHEQGLK